MAWKWISLIAGTGVLFQERIPNYFVVRYRNEAYWIDPDDLETHEHALTLCSDWLETEPSADLYVFRGRLWRARNLNERAEEDADRAVDLESRHYHAWYLKARLLFDQNQYDQAIAIAEQLIEWEPDQGGAYNMRGVCHYRKGDYTAARQNYESCLERRPDYLVALTNDALVDIVQGDHRAGIKKLEQARNTNPLIHYIYSNLAYSYKQTEQWDKALANLDLAIERKPNDYFSRITRANILKDRNETKTQVEDLRVVVYLKPELTSQLNTLSWILATHPDASIRNGKEALAYAETSFARNATALSAMSLAAALAETGDFDRAIEILETEIGWTVDYQTKRSDMLSDFRDQVPYRE